MKRLFCGMGALTLLVLGANLPAQESKNGGVAVTGPYLGQTPPGKTPRIFAPGVISLPGRKEENLAFSPDGKECFFSVWGPKYSSAKIYWTKRVNNAWTPQVEAPFSSNNFSCNPSFSPDGNKIFFQHANYSGPEPYDILMVQRDSQGWSKPKPLPPPINSAYRDGNYTTTLDGVAYFCSNRPGGLDKKGDIWRASQAPGQPLRAENLGVVVNSSAWDAGSVVARDESYLIFTSERPGRIGGSDLYVSFADGKGGWTTPANLNDYCPGINIVHCSSGGASLSPDGRYLFFTRYSRTATGEEADIYWVENPFYKNKPSKTR